MEQAAPHQSPSLLPLWRDLNVFVAAFAAIVSFGGFAVFVPLSIVLKVVLPSRQAELIAWPLGYALVGFFLCWRWWIHGLSPRHLKPERQTRFRLGHALLTLFNLMIVVMFLVASLSAYSLLPRMPAAAGFLAAAASLAPMGVVAGLFMVLSARATAPAFADTLPEGSEAPRQVPSAKWPHGPARVGRAPSVVIVLAGLVVSSLMLFMAGVFGALAFASQREVFSNIVVPVAIGVYAVYAGTAFWLLAKRIGAANWVAWSPVILLTLILPAVQMIGMLIRQLIR